MAAVMAAGAAPSVYADDTYYIYVETDSAALYKGAGYEYDTVGKISKKGRINYIGSAFDKNNTLWYKVGDAKGNAAWIPSDYATRYYKSAALPKASLKAKYASDSSGYQDIYQRIYSSAYSAGAVGAQVTVITGGEEYDWVYGYSEYGYRKMNEDTKLTVGEISETAAAVCAVKMNENGIVNINGGIGNYWGLSFARSISVSMLFTHSSALNRLPVAYNANTAASWLINAANFDANLKPGSSSAWKKNPCGIAIAATTLELASKQTLEGYASANIFQPLGADLSFFSGNITDKNKVGTMYGVKKSIGMLSGEAKTVVPSGNIGEGTANYANGLTGSAKDIAKLFSMLANDGVYGGKRVLSKDSVAAMEKKFFTETENGAQFRQCVGLRYGKGFYGTKGIYYQLGSANGVLSFASYDPDTKNTVVVTVSGAEKKYDKYGIYQACGEIAAEVYDVLSDRNRVLYKNPAAKGYSLQPGDTIGVVAPSGYIKDNAYSKAVNYLKNAGYNVVLSPTCSTKYGFYAGTDKHRARDINDFFEDDSIDAILCLSGGSGATRILQYLDYDMIAQHPKLFIGYSDITALHVALREKSGICTVHGPMLSSFVNTVYRYTSEQFLDGLKRTEPAGAITLPANRKLETVVAGTVEGTIIGGNLTVIASLVGTEYELKGEHNILLIEETDEYASRIDRMLQQLYMNGLFDRIDGIIIGDLTDCPATDGISAEQVVTEFAEKIGKPTIKGMPCGHSGVNMFLPLGVMARMTAKKSGAATLELLENATRSY